MSDDLLAIEDDTAALSLVAAIVGLDPLVAVASTCSDLAGREYVCRCWYVHVRGVECWATPASVTAEAPAHEGEWLGVHEWLYRAGLYSEPMARDLDAEEAKAA